MLVSPNFKIDFI
jgi:hypothetical protein